MTGKRERSRLAKAEIWMILAVKAQEWANDIDPSRIGLTPEERGLLPFEEWQRGQAPGTDQWHVLANRYELDKFDLARLLTDVAQQAENRAMKGGYDEAPLYDELKEMYDYE